MTEVTPVLTAEEWKRFTKPGENEEGEQLHVCSHVWFANWEQVMGREESDCNERFLLSPEQLGAFCLRDYFSWEMVFALEEAVEVLRFHWSEQDRMVGITASRDVALAETAIEKLKALLPPRREG